MILLSQPIFARKTKWILRCRVEEDFDTILAKGSVEIDISDPESDLLLLLLLRSTISVQTEEVAQLLMSERLLQSDMRHVIEKSSIKFIYVFSNIHLVISLDCPDDVFICK